MSENILEVSNLTKKFNKFHAVKNISFCVRKGKIAGLLGPNGAGKTTTIQMLLGLITPTSGEIKIFGKNFKEHREEILQDMNFSSTYTHLPWRLTVTENLHVCALLYSLADPMKKVKSVIKHMGLEKVKDTTIIELSSGWTTRINLARVFLNDPKLILLDEPTSSLDPESARDIREKILHYQKDTNATILWTSHNMAEVEEVCDHVIFLKNGRIIAQDTPENLARTIKVCHVTFMFDCNRNKLKSLDSWKRIDEGKYSTFELNEEDISFFLNKLAQEKITYSQISIDKPTLEDFFHAKA